MRTSGVRFHDAQSIPGDAVPSVVTFIPALTEAEREIVSRIDGLRSIDEISSASGDESSVRSLVFELLWHREAVIEDVITVDELDMFDIIEDEPAPFVLRRRRRNSNSPLVRAIVALCVGNL